MQIYWILFYERPQALQSLADYEKRYYGQKLDIPPDPFGGWVNYDPYAGFDTEQADRMMRQKPRHLRKVA